MKKRVISTSAAPAAIGPYSQAVGIGELVFLSGQIPLDPTTGELVGEDVELQCRQCLTNLGAVLEAAGLGFDDVVRTTIFLADMADFQAVNAIYAEHFGDARPARSTVQVAALPRRARVEIDAIAVSPGAESKP